jgi:hypothetical protein
VQLSVPSNPCPSCGPCHRHAAPAAVMQPLLPSCGPCRCHAAPATVMDLMDASYPFNVLVPGTMSYKECKAKQVHTILLTTHRVAMGQRIVGKQVVQQLCRRQVSFRPSRCHAAPVAIMQRGMRHTSTALYFSGVTKKSLHKPRTASGHRLFHISYGFNYYLQLLYLQFMHKTHLNF